MRTIYKYEMPAGGGSVISLPQGFKPLSVGLDPRGIICMWAEIDTKITKYVKVDFAAIGTGWPFEEFPVNLDEYTFLGTVHDGLVYMWHYYYKVLES